MPREIVQVVETADAVCHLLIEYEEGDSASALGHIYATPRDSNRTATPTTLLATNDTLRTLWASPSGALWTASADGRVGTNAQVKWPSSRTGADYQTRGPSAPWSVTDLPRLRSNGLPVNVTALWGTADGDVYAGAYGGHIFQWRGREWVQTHEGPGSGKGTIRAFGGTGPSDVFAVGQNQTLLHFDGAAWTSLPPVGPPDDSEGFTGVHVLADGSVLISASGRQPRLLHGRAASGLTEFGRYPIQLIDMAAVDTRVLFATGDGVAELISRDVTMIKSTFKTASVNAGRSRAFFIEPAQTKPSYIDYDPGKADLPWARVSY